MKIKKAYKVKHRGWLALALYLLCLTTSQAAAVNAKASEPDHLTIAQLDLSAIQSGSVYDASEQRDASATFLRTDNISRQEATEWLIWTVPVFFAFLGIRRMHHTAAKKTGKQTPQV